MVVGENVAGIVSMALDQVLSDLESQGYETRTFIIPACGVGAPHRRYRCAIVAHNAERDMGGRSKRFKAGRTPNPAEFMMQHGENPAKMNPEWIEWLMGFPIGWTDLKHSGTL